MVFEQSFPKKDVKEGHTCIYLKENGSGRMAHEEKVFCL